MPISSGNVIVSFVVAVGVLAVTTTVPGSAARADQVIAGLRPFERPSSAPTMKDVVRHPGWFEIATKGISEPLPKSLKFLHDQGNWYSPFGRPGMIGPYDIRGLQHGSANTPVAPVKH